MPCRSSPHSSRDAADHRAAEGVVVTSEVPGNSGPAPSANGSEESALPLRIGGLAPLSTPGWIEAGRHLSAGLRLGIAHVNARGGLAGRSVELAVKDTAADPQRAEEAVDDFARMGALAVVGEYHSVAAQAAAVRADQLGLPFLCSSAVLDVLVPRLTESVARIAPPQSYGWQVYAEFLLERGHRRVVVVADSGAYWAAGSRLLRAFLTPRGVRIVELDARAHSPASICDAVHAGQATALLLLTGYPQPACSIVLAARADPRLGGVLLGAPAGQPEFADWASLLGAAGAGVPFLRYMPERLTPLGRRVQSELRGELRGAPSFVALEGYDTVLMLAAAVEKGGTERTRITASWPALAVRGTRGLIKFVRTPGIDNWQWARPPVQVADRDPHDPRRFRVLAQAGSRSPRRLPGSCPNRSFSVQPRSGAWVRCRKGTAARIGDSS
ncbi:ABC transporter substrate-binding protein [Microbacterium oxydans]|uniref:ABC transporter substrate-binding protein n=1 Tax=Microbacterium oxydans TaxID=82380 RepID=UPI003626EA22